jgi:death-on-curing protein
MRYLTLNEVLDLHRLMLEQSGGLDGVRDVNGLDSAVVQPAMMFAGHELYPTIAEKASALAFSLIMNHPFIDGNKRVGHAAMETFLVLNGYELNASVDEQEQVILRVAASELGRDEFTEWVRAHLDEMKSS